MLHIIDNSKTPTVRLVETEGIDGARYCALSHCWGPANKQPLRTTQENYQSHLGGILYEKLPKSFRDAIILTQGLNVEYLWIDSLCIVQNDEEDWRSEAGKMAGVYRNAELVIAASDARDSTEGLFITDRKRESPVAVPYTVEGMTKGSFNIAPLPVQEWGPINSHLNTRAWAFQERLLARRIMFFTRGGISWKCSGLETWERGASLDLIFYENQSWLSLLNNYCEKRMTNSGDRLYALKGVTDEMQHTRQDLFNSVYGIWESDIYAQLLWRQDESPLEAEALDLPTWTWAATGGAKRWCGTIRDIATPQAMPIVLDIGLSETLVSSGHCSRRPVGLKHLVHGNWIYRQQWTTEYVCPFYEAYMLPGYWGRTDYPVYVINSLSCTLRILGLSVFDREPSTSATCFFVAKQERYAMRESDEIPSDSGNDRQRDKGSARDCAHDGERHNTEPLSDSAKPNPECTTGADASSGEASEPPQIINSVSNDDNDSHWASDASDASSSDEIRIKFMDPEDAAIVIIPPVHAQQCKSNSLRLKRSYIYQEQHRSSTGVFYSNQRAKASTSASVSPCSTPTHSKPLAPSLQNSKSSRFIAKIMKRY
jgi:hypothetical protein